MIFFDRPRNVKPNTVNFIHFIICLKFLSVPLQKQFFLREKFEMEKENHSTVSSKKSKRPQKSKTSKKPVETANMKLPNKKRSNSSSAQPCDNQHIHKVTDAKTCRAVVKKFRSYVITLARSIVFPFCNFSLIFRHCEEYSVLAFSFFWKTNNNKTPFLQLSSHRGLCAHIYISVLKRIPDDLKVCY